MATAQISEEDTLLAEEEVPVAEAIELPAEEEAPAAAAAAPPRARARAAPRIVEEDVEGVGVRVCLLGTTILLVLAGFVAVGASNVDATGLGGAIADMVKGMMQP
jgi:hypothetical protein